MKKRIVLLGVRSQTDYMAKSLIRKDFAISYYGLNFPQEEQGAHQCRDKDALWSALREADALILPDPVSRDGMTVRENMLETPVLGRSAAAYGWAAAFWRQVSGQYGGGFGKK